MTVSYLIIVPVTAAVLTAAAGLYTVALRPLQPAKVFFALVMSTLCIIAAGTALMLFDSGIYRTEGALLSLTGQSFFPPALFLFASVYARHDHRKALRRALPVAGFMSALSIYLLVSIHTGGVFINHSPDPYGGYFLIGLGPSGRHFYIYLILSSIAGLVVLEDTFRASKGAIASDIRKLILGLGAITAAIVYLSSNALLFSSIGAEPLLLLSALIITGTLIAAGPVLGRRLDYSGIYISRKVFYRSVTLLASGLYLLTLGLVAKGITYLRLPLEGFVVPLFVFTALIVFIMVLFSERLRRKVYLFITKNFYRDKYDFREKWLETTERISSKREVPDVVGTLCGMISETLAPETLHIYLYEPISRSYVLYNGSVKGLYRRFDEKHSFIEKIRSAGKDPFYLYDKNSATYITDLVKATGALVCAPMRADGVLTGFVLLGADITGEPYTPDDLELLRAIASQAAVQIRNIELAKELMSARDLEAFNRMCAFVMHDIKNLTHSLSLLSRNARYNMDDPEFRKEAVEAIESTASRMKALMDRLSGATKGMELKREHVRLDALLNNLLRRFPMSSSKRIEVTTDISPTPPVYVDPQAMEMVLYNFLINACDSIRDSGMVKIEVEPDNSEVRIRITDNGEGMTMDHIRDSLFRPFRSTKDKGFGIGLYQCRTIVEAHGGRIEVESAPGRGTSFTVKVPLYGHGRYH